jgi:hypothetical protein
VFYEGNVAILISATFNCRNILLISLQEVDFFVVTMTCLRQINSDNKAEASIKAARSAPEGFSLDAGCSDQC